MSSAILKTLAYFDLFDYPLTKEELRVFLWRAQDVSFPEPVDGFFFLKGRGEIVRTRQNRSKIAQKLWKKVHRYVGFLRMIPFIKMVAVCNNLAYNNPHPGSDIDLLIVIEKKRLWLIRFLITGLFHILGVRRHGKKIAGRFCLSFFLTEESYDLSTIALFEDDIYLAYWLAILRPVLNFDGTYEAFTDSNKKFVQNVLPNFSFSHKIAVTRKSFLRKCLHFLLQGKIGDLFEKVLKSMLKNRALKKAQKLGSDSGVIISDTMLKFHDRDRRKEYYERWKRSISKVVLP